MKRIRTVLTFVSAGLCGLLFVLYVISFHLDSRTQGVAVTPSFHFGFFDGGAYFYSHEHPYLDGIWRLSGTNAPKPVVSGWHVGDYYGYYHSSSLERYGTNSGTITATMLNLPGTRFREISYFYENRPIWTFLLSLWYPILLLAIFPLLWLFRRSQIWLQKS